MPANISYRPDNTYILRISGVLKRSEFGEGQAVIGQQIDAGTKPRIVAILERFEGWERGADWNDLDFQLTHGKDIAAIAIVGDDRWEAEALAFAGAGFRRAPVRFFRPDQMAAVVAWIDGTGVSPEASPT